MCRVGTTMDHELCDFILATVEAINYKAAGGFLDDHLPRTRIEVGCASSRTKHGFCSAPCRLSGPSSGPRAPNPASAKKTRLICAKLLN